MRRGTLAAVALLIPALLGGCVVPVPDVPWEPIPPPCGSTYQPDADSTFQPKIPGDEHPEVVKLEATAHPRGCLVGVRIDATDQFGRHGHNADYGGLPYPWNGIRREPYTHRIWFDRRLELDVLIEVFTHGEDYDLRGCRILYHGEAVAAKVVEQDPSIPEHFTLCRAHVRGSKVTP